MQPRGMVERCGLIRIRLIGIAMQPASPSSVSCLNAGQRGGQRTSFSRAGEQPEDRHMETVDLKLQMAVKMHALRKQVGEEGTAEQEDSDDDGEWDV